MSVILCVCSKYLNQNYFSNEYWDILICDDYAKWLYNLWFILDLWWINKNKFEICVVIYFVHDEILKLTEKFYWLVSFFFTVYWPSITWSSGHNLSGANNVCGNGMDSLKPYRGQPYPVGTMPCRCPPGTTCLAIYRCDTVHGTMADRYGPAQCKWIVQADLVHRTVLQDCSTLYRQLERQLRPRSVVVEKISVENNSRMGSSESVCATQSLPRLQSPNVYIPCHIK